MFTTTAQQGQMGPNQGQIGQGKMGITKDKLDKFK
ncbi:unnamed protein product (macronuclear) [Paramecium tetraurelia]|uniref:Uncharacterized protein n=1 Tax=Paramecium tetraurelia TaxID=5888 RepID=A0C2Z6_PARTE|nr:uncharacterized protein GSPATT00034641001 [Paramecium tetraurelia]CAK65163.1 unnamed protein product [Paramecium tetraurelia]|eukprot:XP_001432560.1 hypothetical protein (macronuclear) [Paramecium tetraurelia strain d4-2]